VASIHIEEIHKYLKDKISKDSIPYTKDERGFFLEINFHDKSDKTRCLCVDEEYKNVVITVDCSYGIATIVFDEYGMLSSLDIS